METCQKCGSNCIYSAVGHGKDLNWYTYKGHEGDGYLPSVDNLGGGDDLEISVCLECGQAQGEWPVKGPIDQVKCPECREYIEIEIGEETECPECLASLYPKDEEELEAKSHGGDVDVQVPTRKCRLLVPVEFAGYEIGRELFIESESPKFFYVEIMHNRVELLKGVEAEECESSTALVKEKERDHFCALAFKL